MPRTLGVLPARIRALRPLLCRITGRLHHFSPSWHIGGTLHVSTQGHGPFQWWHHSGMRAALASGRFVSEAYSEEYMPWL